MGWNLDDGQFVTKNGHEFAKKHEKCQKCAQINKNWQKKKMLFNLENCQKGIKNNGPKVAKKKWKVKWTKSSHKN